MTERHLAVLGTPATNLCLCWGILMIDANVCCSLSACCITKFHHHHLPCCCCCVDLQSQHAATDLAEWEKEQRSKAEEDIRDMQQEAQLEAAMKKDKKVSSKGGREICLLRDLPERSPCEFSSGGQERAKRAGGHAGMTGRAGRCL